ncbi:unnamed protein product [Cylicocyclus nassatus]|uniref:Apple domain-containing protein n=1 Tax=Cylicocyclus nassatus TaxID=53992 RepID=A0AA36MB94_CYLNA|nr:unnamed protein product [Cylicocyclus nassatus]
MKSAILVLLVLQMDWASLCTFQREDVPYGSILGGVFTNESTCFATCLNNKNCTRLCYKQVTGFCAIFKDGYQQQVSFSGDQCYSLHRDSVKPPQYSRILKFIRKDSEWLLA